MGRVSFVTGLLRRNPDFARLYVALLIAFAADWFATVALVGLVLDTTGSAAAAAVILVLQTAPFLVATPIAGMLADRLDRRRLLVAANLARAVVCVGLIFAGTADTVWIAFVVVALLAFSAAFFEPTVTASLPNLVDEADLPTANALIGSAWGTMVAVGAAVGGVVAATLGRETTFLIYPFLFLASAWLVHGVRRSLREQTSSADSELAPLGLAGLRSTITETVGLARTDRAIAAFLFTKTTFGIGSGMIAMLAITSDDLYGAGALGVGLLFMARGVGAFIGPFAARRFATDDRPRVLHGISIAFVVYIFGYGLVPLAPGVLLAGVGVLIGHIGGGAQWTLSSFGLQRAAPDRIRGRVLSVDFGLALASAAISTLLAGWLAIAFGPTVALYVMLGLLVLSGIVWLVWTRDARRPSADPVEARLSG